MEISVRLNHIEQKIKLLKSRCDILENENRQLLSENNDLKTKLEDQTQKLLYLAETNKISKLAQSASSSDDRSELKQRIEQIIKEIDQCLNLVKQ